MTIENQDTNEIWKDVPGYGGLYKVSNLGRVKSLKRLVKSNWENERWQNGRLLRFGWLKGKDGYNRPFVNLSKEGKAKIFMVHRLVLLAFVGPRPKGCVARHFPDRDPSNNRLSNLQWGTYAENAADRLVHGTANRGIKHGNAKLSEKKIEKIKQLLEQGVTQKRIAEIIGICQAHVSRINTGKQWGWINEKQKTDSDS